MALDIRTKLALQKEASQIKKDLPNVSIRERLALQKRWSFIIKRLKGLVDDNGNNIEQAANEAATGNNEQPEPTEGQKLAGNYKKGDITISGIDVRIENPKGSVRSGTSPDGTKWSITMKHHYGDLKGSKGADGDPVDVFVGESTEFEKVYIVDQIEQDGSFDEHKVMLGFDSLNEARKAYLANYDDDWQGLGDITAMPIDKFSKWYKAGTKSNPAGSLPTISTGFLDDYLAGCFFNLEPLAFSELIKQADEYGLPLEQNQNVAKSYVELSTSHHD